MSHQELAGVAVGDRYWKLGDRKHKWEVDGLVPASGDRNAYVILVREDGDAVEEVELTHLKDPEQYQPAG